jgi:acyl carrier protein
VKQVDIERLYSVISDVLNIPSESISEESSSDTIDSWSSLTHINLIVSIESEFNVQFSVEDTIDMLSVKLIRMILEDILPSRLSL